MKKDSVTRNSVKISVEDSLQKVVDILENEDGRSFEDKKAEAVEYLKTLEDSLLAERLVKNASNEEDGRIIKEKFWREGIVHISEDMILRDTREEDKDSFLEIQKQYGLFKSMLQEEAYQNMLWNEHTGKKALSCSILVNGQYAGYCGINNVAHETWEICIELLKEWTGQGVGYAAVNALIGAIGGRLNVKEFRIRIDPGNVASRKLFEKLGAVPNGISTHLLHKEEDILRCEEENLESIDEELTTLAARFGVEPRKLLSHVLEYRLVHNT